MATEPLTLTRREFLIGTAAAGAGFSLGLYLPFASGPAAAAERPPEVNAWVVIRPDDRVIIRIARSEMGQGTLTGLAQLALSLEDRHAGSSGHGNQPSESHGRSAAPGRDVLANPTMYTKTPLFASFQNECTDRRCHTLFSIQRRRQPSTVRGRSTP